MSLRDQESDRRSDSTTMTEPLVYARSFRTMFIRVSLSFESSVTVAARPEDSHTRAPGAVGALET